MMNVEKAVKANAEELKLVKKLIKAIENGNLIEVQNLIEGYPILKDSFFETDGFNETHSPLTLALCASSKSKEHIAIAMFLLNSGVKTKSSNLEGYGPAQSFPNALAYSCFLRKASKFPLDFKLLRTLLEKTDALNPKFVWSGKQYSLMQFCEGMFALPSLVYCGGQILLNAILREEIDTIKELVKYNPVVVRTVQLGMDEVDTILGDNSSVVKYENVDWADIINALVAQKKNFRRKW
jgi:hypothetical protein